MNFLYKINSGFDGFTPKRLPERVKKGRLVLKWTRYIDEVERGSRVWIYFHGPHAFKPGVYAKGRVTQIREARDSVVVDIYESSADTPITDTRTSGRLGKAVQARGLQVFYFSPESLSPRKCDVAGAATTCAARQCAKCAEWRSFPLLGAAPRLPPRLPESLALFAPAYWVVPTRCFLVQEGHGVSRRIRKVSDLFYRFKTGDKELAFAFALGMRVALKQNHAPRFDFVVPIPLSPDKAKKGEVNRTRLLSQELARLLKTPASNSLELTKPISKKRLRVRRGLTATQFEAKYTAALKVKPELKRANSVLLVDDVATDGSTLRCAVEAIHALNPNCSVSAATAGLMIKKQVVRSVTGLIPRGGQQLR